MLLKLCRCGRQIPIEIHRCNSCSSATDTKDNQRLYDKNVRDKRSRAFYNSRSWRILSNQFRIKQYNLCKSCGKFANVVDHIIPIKEDWSRRLDERNLQCLCHKCHNKKTANDKKVYPKG